MRGALEKLQGVQEATVDWEEGSALVSYDPEGLTLQQLQEAVEASSDADHVYRVVGSRLAEPWPPPR